MVNASAMNMRWPHSAIGAPSKGEEIRAKIEANRQKRLRIADAMKAEASVIDHDINYGGLDGMAFGGTGRIYSPEGRKMDELYTLAHECGHIFLHNQQPGLALPTHIKEMEAESYAQQAFLEHGMAVPRREYDWGRTYVGSWVDKDRAKGIAIDPRVEAYVRGDRSPYEPLRMVPATWTLHAAAPSDPAPAPAVAPARVTVRPPPDPIRIRDLLPIRHRKYWSGLTSEAKDICGFTGRALFKGIIAAYFGLKIWHLFYPDPGMFEGPSGVPTGEALSLMLVIALITANVAVMWQTMMRR